MSCSCYGSAFQTNLRLETLIGIMLDWKKNNMRTGWRERLRMLECHTLIHLLTQVGNRSLRLVPAEVILGCCSKQNWFVL